MSGAENLLLGIVVFLYTRRGRDAAAASDEVEAIAGLNRALQAEVKRRTENEDRVTAQMRDQDEKCQADLKRLHDDVSSLRDENLDLRRRLDNVDRRQTR